MNENKIVIDKPKFVEFIVNEVMEIVKDHQDVGIILSGGIITDFLCEELFTDTEVICITKEEYCKLTSSAIHKFTTDKDNKELAVPISLLAIFIVGNIKLKLFSEESVNNE